MDILAIAPLLATLLPYLIMAALTAIGPLITGPMEGRRASKEFEIQTTAAKAITKEEIEKAQRARYGEKIRLALAKSAAPAEALQASMASGAEQAQQAILQTLAQPAMQTTMMGLYGGQAGQTFGQGVQQAAKRADIPSFLRETGFSPEAYAAYQSPLTPPFGQPGMEAA